MAPMHSDIGMFVHPDFRTHRSISRAHLTRKPSINNVQKRCALKRGYEYCSVKRAIEAENIIGVDGCPILPNFLLPRELLRTICLACDSRACHDGFLRNPNTTFCVLPRPIFGYTAIRNKELPQRRLTVTNNINSNPFAITPQR